MHRRGEISLLIISLLLVGASLLGIGAGNVIKNLTSIVQSRAADGPGGYCNKAINNGCYGEDGCRDWEWCNDNYSCEWRAEFQTGKKTCAEQKNSGTIVNETAPQPPTQTQKQPQGQATASCDDENWSCLGECANADVRNAMGQDANLWRRLKVEYTNRDHGTSYTSCGETTDLVTPQPQQPVVQEPVAQQPAAIAQQPVAQTGTSSSSSTGAATVGALTCQANGITHVWGTCFPLSEGVVVQCFPNDTNAVQTTYNNNPYTGWVKLTACTNRSPPTTTSGACPTGQVLTLVAGTDKSKCVTRQPTPTQKPTTQATTQTTTQGNYYIVNPKINSGSLDYSVCTKQRRKSDITVIAKFNSNNPTSRSTKIMRNTFDTTPPDYCTSQRFANLGFTAIQAPTVTFTITEGTKTYSQTFSKEALQPNMVYFPNLHQTNSRPQTPTTTTGTIPANANQAQNAAPSPTPTPKAPQGLANFQERQCISPNNPASSRYPCCFERITKPYGYYCSDGAIPGYQPEPTTTTSPTPLPKGLVLRTPSTYPRDYCFATSAKLPEKTTYDCCSKYHNANNICITYSPPVTTSRVVPATPVVANATVTPTPRCRTGEVLTLIAGTDKSKCVTIPPQKCTINSIAIELKDNKIITTTKTTGNCDDKKAKFELQRVYAWLLNPFEYFTETKMTYVDKKITEPIVFNLIQNPRVTASGKYRVSCRECGSGGGSLDSNPITFSVIITPAPTATPRPPTPIITPRPTATTAPQPPSPTPTPTSSSITLETKPSSLLFYGPDGQKYPTMGGTGAGREVKINGKNSTGNWYQIDWNGGKAWIFKNGLLGTIPSDLPVIAAPPIPTAAPRPPTPTSTKRIYIPFVARQQENQNAEPTPTATPHPTATTAPEPPTPTSIPTIRVNPKILDGVINIWNTMRGKITPKPTATTATPTPIPIHITNVQAYASEGLHRVSGNYTVNGRSNDSSLLHLEPDPNPSGGDMVVERRNIPSLTNAQIQSLPVTIYDDYASRVYSLINNSIPSPAPTPIGIEVQLTNTKVYSIGGATESKTIKYYLVGRDATNKYLFLNDNPPIYEDVVVARNDLPSITDAVVNKLPVINKLSSYIKPTLTPAPTTTTSCDYDTEPPYGEVFIYVDADHKGACKVAIADVPYLKDEGGFESYDDSISSFKVGPNTKFTIYWDRDYGNKESHPSVKKEFTTSEKYLTNYTGPWPVERYTWNDKISSFTIETTK